jgi:hypothetical protein
MSKALAAVLAAEIKSGAGTAAAATEDGVALRWRQLCSGARYPSNRFVPTWRHGDR